MKKLLMISACSLPLLFGSIAFAQTTGAPPVGGGAGAPAVEASTPKETVPGLSVKKTVLNENVYNEEDDKVGDIRDLVLDDTGQATHYIVGAGGFLGMGEHNVAIPYEEIQRRDNEYTLSGYTKDRLKDMPGVEVTN